MRCTPLLTFIFTLSFFISFSVSAENGNSEWRPEAIKFDWVQLTSGEWLRGKLKSMYNKKLEFDSDKLNLLSIDWKDVKYLQSFQPGNVKIENNGSIIGVLTISDKKITVKNKQEILEFKRDEIISFSPAGDREIDLWSLKFTLGVNLKSGNTEQVDINSKLSAKRRTANSRFLLDYIGNLSKTNAISGDLVETINNHRLSGALDIYVTRYFFYNPINAEFYIDLFQNIELRTTIGAGLGYTFVDTGITEWNVTVGPAFISTKYNSVQAGDDIRVDSGSLKISTKLDTELTKTIDFIYKYNILISETKSGGYSHHMIATLQSEISRDLDFDISAVWDRITHPTIDDTGFEPEQDDYQVLLGMSYSF